MAAPAPTPRGMLSIFYGKPETLAKLRAESDLEQLEMFFGHVAINGVVYCRPHLMVRCHLCEDSQEHLQEECDEERQEMGLREGGDERFNAHASKWGTKVMEKQMLVQSHMEMTRLQKGDDYYKKHPDEWSLRVAQLQADERELNDGFLAAVDDVIASGASQCCYWGCEAPDASKLSRCSGCRIVKYCCVEHQKADWKWGHRVECSSRVPEKLLAHWKAKREAHLRGDYQ